jgi:hypothetical protein
MVDTSSSPLLSFEGARPWGPPDLRAVFFEVINSSCNHLGRDLAVPAIPALGL